MLKYLICTAQSRILALDAWSTNVSPQLFICLLYACFLCFKWPPWTWQHNSLLESMVLLMPLVQNIVYSNPTELLILLFIVLVIQSLSHVQLLVSPMDCSKTCFSVLHYLLEFAQTHVHGVRDAIQPSYPLLPPSPPALSFYQGQVFFQWISSSHQMAKVL